MAFCIRWPGNIQFKGCIIDRCLIKELFYGCHSVSITQSFGAWGVYFVQYVVKKCCNFSMLVKCFCTKSNSIMVIKWFVEILAFVTFAPKKTQNDSKKVRGQDNVVMLIQRFFIVSCCGVWLHSCYHTGTATVQECNHTLLSILQEWYPSFFPFSRIAMLHTMHHYRNATTHCESLQECNNSLLSIVQECKQEVTAFL